MEQSVVHFEKILAATRYDGVGGICDGGLLAALLGSRISQRSSVHWILNLCGSPWEWVPKPLRTRHLIPLRSLHLLGLHDEVRRT